jgi:carboxyl-terminal processing protease
MPWDRIAPAKYKKWQPDYNLDSLRKWSINRTKDDSAFIATDNFAKYLKADNDKSIVPLNYKEYRVEQKKKRLVRKHYSKEINKKINLNFVFLKDDKIRMKQDTLMKYRYKNWEKTLRKDFKLQEAFNIVEDMKKFK